MNAKDNEVNDLLVAQWSNPTQAWVAVTSIPLSTWLGLFRTKVIRATYKVYLVPTTFFIFVVSDESFSC